MGGILKGLQSVLIALAVICIIGTAVILWYNKGGGSGGEDTAQLETTQQAETMPENNFPGVIPVSTVSENTGNDTAQASAGGEHVHSYTPQVIKDASCTEIGQMKYTCSCGDYYIDSIAALQHNAGEWTVVRQATASQTGLRQQKCKRCGTVLQEEVIPKLAAPSTNTNTNSNSNRNNTTTTTSGNDHKHRYVAEVTTEADCTTNGVMTYTCKCGSTYTEPIPATNHPSRQTLVTDAGCTEPGSVETTCAICKAVLSHDSLPATGHSWGSYKVTQPPTLKAAGKKTRTCKNCGEEESIDIPMLTTSGPNANHTHNYTAEVTTLPTCDKAGVKTYSCSCEDSYTEEIPALGHAPGNWTIIEQPTLEKEGLQKRICRRCGKEIDSETIPKLEQTHTHSFVSEIVRQPTCTAEGKKVYTCPECGYSYPAYIDKIEHNYIMTPQDDGTFVWICKVCGDVQQPDE